MPCPRPCSLMSTRRMSPSSLDTPWVTRVLITWSLSAVLVRVVTQRDRDWRRHEQRLHSRRACRRLQLMNLPRCPRGIPLTGNTIVATTAGVTTGSALTDCTDSATPTCSGDICVTKFHSRWYIRGTTWSWWWLDSVRSLYCCGYRSNSETTFWSVKGGADDTEECVLFLRWWSAEFYQCASGIEANSFLDVGGDGSRWRTLS